MAAEVGIGLLPVLPVEPWISLTVGKPHY